MVAWKNVYLPVLLIICCVFSLFITLGLAEHVVLSTSTQLELSICLLVCLSFSWLVSCWLAVSPLIGSKGLKESGPSDMDGHLGQEADKLRHHATELAGHAERAARREEERSEAQSQDHAALEVALCSAVENAVASREERHWQGMSEYLAEVQQVQKALGSFLSERASSSQEDRQLTFRQSQQDDAVQSRLKAIAAEQSMAESRMDAQLKLLHQEQGALQKQMKMTCHRLNEINEHASNRTEKAQNLLLSSLTMQQQSDSERLEARVREILDNPTKLGARTEGVCQRVSELAQLAICSQSVEEQTRALQALVLAADVAQQQLNQPFKTTLNQYTNQPFRSRYSAWQTQLSPPSGRSWSASKSRVIPQSAWSPLDKAKWG
eukprot:gnl/MRDRNA2_/MRDRNA2_83574_c0_seq3.p1 gnl/MRDRNA2_/MRDRNA2_83574_c0~~gnl/MRDRNA2_/MRDRNA2_83574_c0_seq3.p1  ORF type:complete len:379 (-),score=81.16 gnl/MRDRNA2_/MRDRNA2_83574_c0_seq3:125-1261(-)